MNTTFLRLSRLHSSLDNIPCPKNDLTTVCVAPSTDPPIKKASLSKVHKTLKFGENFYRNLKNGAGGHL